MVQIEQVKNQFAQIDKKIEELLKSKKPLPLESDLLKSSK